MRRRAILWWGCGVVALVMIAYAGAYLRLRLQRDFVHHASWSPSTHRVELDGDRGRCAFMKAMLSGAPDWEARLEREERDWQRLATFFLPLRWLECRWWDLFYRQPIL